MASRSKSASKSTSRRPAAARPVLPYSLPAMSPLYVPPPFDYRDGWSQFVLFKTDPAAVAPFIPEPVTPDPSGLMTMTISTFFASSFGAYNEATLCAMARFKNKPVSYALQLILDNDIAICGGREIWGWPKKLGRVNLDVVDGVVHSSVERGGCEIIKAAVEIGPRIDMDELDEGALDFINLKLIPSVKNGAAPEVAQLTKTSLSNFKARSAYQGRGTLAFGESPVDRFSQFPVLEVVDALYYNADFVLGDGTVVHDYLK